MEFLPKNESDIANQHLDFSKIGLEVKQVSFYKSRDGQQLLGNISLSLDSALNNAKMEELVDTIQFRNYNKKRLSSENIILESYSIIDPKNILLDLKINSKAFKFLIHMDYFSTPDNLETVELSEMKFEFISRNNKTLECPIHPDFLILKKEEYGEKEDADISPRDNQCVTAFNSHHIIECGWEEGKVVSLGYKIQDIVWFEDVIQLNNHAHFNFYYLIYRHMVYSEFGEKEYHFSVNGTGVFETSIQQKMNSVGVKLCLIQLKMTSKLESYLGRNMQKAIENEANGRWPVGLESLQNILGKQGNMVTVDNMLLLRNHHPAIPTGKKCVMQSEPVNPNLTSPMVAVPVQIIQSSRLQ